MCKYIFVLINTKNVFKGRGREGGDTAFPENQDH